MARQIACRVIARRTTFASLDGVVSRGGAVAFLMALGGTLASGCKSANSGGESDAGHAFLAWPGPLAPDGGTWLAATGDGATGAAVPDANAPSAPALGPVVPAGAAAASQAALQRTAPFPETPRPGDRRDGPELVYGMPHVTGGLLGDIDPALRRMRAGFLACYTRALEDGERAPRTATLSLHMAVMPNGSVRTARAEATAGISPGAVDCILRRAQTATFPPSGGDPADVVLPLTLHP